MNEKLKRTKTTGNCVNIAGVVDSGAVASVAPENIAEWIPKKENDASKKGAYYVAAGGSEIYNEGEKFFEGFSDTGAAMRNTMQIADVNRPLFAVR